MNKYFNILKSSNLFTSTERLVYACLTLELLIMLCSGVGFHSLCHAPYFNIGIDPVYGLFFGLNIPQTIISHQWLGLGLDILMLLIPLLTALGFGKRIFKMMLFVLLLIYYCTLTGYLGHRNFQSGFVFVTIPFLFQRPQNGTFTKEFLRYWVLFFYASAGCFKLISAGIYQTGYFSESISHQYLPYFIENHLNWRTAVHLWITNHKEIGYGLYLCATFLELSLIIGFFTKKFDRVLLFLIIFFHLSNWLVMDIAPWGQLSLLIFVFYLQHFDIRMNSDS